MFASHFPHIAFSTRPLTRSPLPHLPPTLPIPTHPPTHPTIPHPSQTHPHARRPTHPRRRPPEGPGRAPFAPPSRTRRTRPTDTSTAPSRRSTTCATPHSIAAASSLAAPGRVAARCVARMGVILTPGRCARSSFRVSCRRRLDPIQSARAHPRRAAGHGPMLPRRARYRCQTLARRFAFESVSAYAQADLRGCV